MISVNDCLGGGNSNIFQIFTPKIGEDEPILIDIFQKEVDTTNYLWTPNNPWKNEGFKPPIYGFNHP